MFADIVFRLSFSHFRGIAEELACISFTKENTPVQICPIEPDPCDPDMAATASTGPGEDSDDAVEPVPPKKTKAAVGTNEDASSECSGMIGARPRYQYNK